MPINFHNEICTPHLHKHSEVLGKGRQCMYVSDFRPAIETVNTLPARGLIITRPGGGGGADNAPATLAPVRATNTKVRG